MKDEKEKKKKESEKEIDKNDPFFEYKKNMRKALASKTPTIDTV